ncbi:MAG TPA: hypothetical protein VH023_12185 [Rhodopila sp.]|nr:hypothetical protein [Rhodopila sp.]
MSFMDAVLPALSDAFVPPTVRGTADLTDFAYQGHDYETLMARIGESRGCNPPDAEAAAWTYDASIAAQLGFRRAEGLNLQDAALSAAQVYRIGAAPRAGHPPLRLLALVGPGDLMTNTPLDFLTNHLNVRLDLLYVLPERGLPPVIPDHEVAFFAIGEADPSTLVRLRQLYAAWPRPALNDPHFLPVLERDALSRCLAGVPGLCSPAAVAVSRAALDDHLGTGRAIQGIDLAAGPYLIRPAGSHAGSGLSRIRTPADLADYLRFSFERHFFLTAFEDYASPDGLYRKSRVAFIDRQPFLCHMAVSQNWMVHYLNAGMTESAERRAEEAQAMAGFEAGFARRHAAAFDALHQRLGFDYYSIDCAETRDGRLLVFEADAAAIIHLMDPPDLFPYKQPAMRKVFAAFDAMLRRRVMSSARTR